MIRRVSSILTPDDEEKLHVLSWVRKKDIVVIFTEADYAYHGVKASSAKAGRDYADYVRTKILPVYVKSWVRMEWRKMR